MTLAGCASLPGRAPLGVTLPTHPMRCAVPPGSPAIVAGDNAKLLAGRALATLDMANRAIVDCHVWYEDVRGSYAKGRRK